LAYATHKYKEPLKLVLELLKAMGFETLDLENPVIIDSDKVRAHINSDLLSYKTAFDLQRVNKITTEKSLYTFIASKLECVGLSLKGASDHRSKEKQLELIDKDKLLKYGISLKPRIHKDTILTYIFQDNTVDICDFL
jgi:hypothetical protein